MVEAIKSTQGNYYEIHHKNATNNMKYAVVFKTQQNYTGLLWSMCTIDNKYTSPTPQIQLIITGATNSKVGLNWTLKCEDMITPITGYVISYCKGSDEKLQKCNGEIHNITIKGDKTNGQYEIEDLEMDTRYLIWISTLSVFGKYQFSEKLSHLYECKCKFY